MVGYGAVDHASSDASPHAGSSRTRVWCKATAVLAVAAAAVLVLAALRSTPRKHETTASTKLRLNKNNQKEESEALHGDGTTKVYLGNGCFWARQYALVTVEQHSAVFHHRSSSQVSSLAGYAGSTNVGPGGLVCYHGGPAGTDYAELGDCEVVQVALDAGEDQGQLRALLKSYFASFVSLASQGMQRPDPQDAGRQYRSAIGIPGGIDGPLMPVIRASNVDGMQLLAGLTGVSRTGKGGDEDQINTVWIYDTEQYHQFYKGPASVKEEQEHLGSINPTGCPESSW